MRNEIIKALIIGAAIIVAALLHGAMGRDVGRYQVSREPNGVALRIDTITGELFDPDGRPWPGPGKQPQIK